MHTVEQSVVEAKAGEPVQITLTVTDNDGDNVTVAGGTAVFKIARKVGKTAILTKTEAGGVTLSTNKAVINFNTDELKQNNKQQLGDFFWQLRLTIDGVSLYVAEGPLTVFDVIS